VKPAEFSRYPALEDITKQSITAVNALCHAYTELCIIYQELIKKETLYQVQKTHLLELVAFMWSNTSPALDRYKIPAEVTNAFYYSMSDSFNDIVKKLVEKGWNDLANFLAMRNVYKDLTYEAVVNKDHFAMTAIFHLLLREPLLYKDTNHYLKVPSSIEDGYDVGRFFHRIFFEEFFPIFTDRMEKICVRY
jgi:hypothetical protein